MEITNAKELVTALKVTGNLYKEALIFFSRDLKISYANHIAKEAYSIRLGTFASKFFSLFRSLENEPVCIDTDPLEQVFRSFENRREVHLVEADTYKLVSFDFESIHLKDGVEAGILCTISDQSYDLSSTKRETNDQIISASIEAEDKQRRLIAQILHDGVQQTLIAAKMNFESIKKSIDNGTLERFETGLSFINQGIEEIRMASHNLMPQFLEKEGLCVAVSTLSDQLDRACEKTNFHFITNLEDQHRFPKHVEIGFYRIIQEAANNIIKYSEASQALFRIVFEEGKLELLIKDNGIGFDISKIDQTESFGLIGMKNRAISFGGCLEIQSWPNRGTKILAVVDQQTPAFSKY